MEHTLYYILDMHFTCLMFQTLLHSDNKRCNVPTMENARRVVMYYILAHITNCTVILETDTQLSRDRYKTNNGILWYKYVTHTTKETMSMTGKIDTYNLWCRLSFIMLSIWINILGIISVVSFLVMLISNWTTPQWMNYCEEIMRTVTGSWHNRSVLTIVFKTQRWCFIQTIPGKALGTHVVRITSQTIVYACCKYTSF